jgi:hypothetical protein
MDESDCQNHLCICCCVPGTDWVLGVHHRCENAALDIGDTTDMRIGQVGYERQAERGHDCRVLDAGSLRGNRIVHMRGLENKTAICFEQED